MLQLTSKRIKGSLVAKTIESEGLGVGTATAVAATTYKIGSAIERSKVRIGANLGVIALGTFIMAESRNSFIRSSATGLIIGGVSALLLPRRS